MTKMNSIMIADGYGGKFKFWNVMYANGSNCSVTQEAKEALIDRASS